jgi:hypothetical protein
MEAGGPNFFLGVAGGATEFSIDTAFGQRIGERIDRVRLRRFALPEPAVLARSVPAAAATLRERLVRSTAQLLSGLALGTFGLWLISICLGHTYWICLSAAFLCGLGSVLLRSGAAVAREVRRQLALETLHTDLSAAAGEWLQLTGWYQSEFARLRGKLRQLHDEYDKLPARYEAERPDRRRNRKAYFRDQYLRGCFISDHDIDRIGPSRKVLLASYGIETAYDVEAERVSAVRGMGPVLTGNLVAWKKRMLAQFQYDPRAPVPETDVRAVANKFRQLEESLRARLLRGAADLEALAGRTEEQLRPIEERMWRLLSQAR